jgi:hypothetical protein
MEPSRTDPKPGGPTMKANAPSFAKTTTLVARALGLTSPQLHESFRPATLADLPGVLELRRRVIGENLTWDDSRYLQWRYDFEGRPDGHGSCLIVASGGKMHGMIGAEKIRLAVGHETLDALSLMDIMVQPELDGSGLGIWLNMAVFEQHPVVIEIGANPNSLGLINRLFHRLPDRKVYVAPLSFSRFLANRLHISPVANVLALPANAAAVLWRALSFRPKPSRWYFHDIARFDASVERLFAERWAPEEVTLVRSSNYLNWRLFRNPRATYKVFGAWENGDLVCYAAYQSSLRPDGLRSVSLVDWLVDRRYGLEGFKTLVRETVTRAWRERADIVTVTPLHARSEKSLLGLGFLSQLNQYNTVGVRCTDPARWPGLHDGDAWFLTEAHTDRDGIS